MPSSSGQRGYRKTARWYRHQRAAVLKKFGGCCAGCGYPGDDGQGKGLTQAHIVDHALGGSDEIGNIVLLCRSCHGRIDGGKSNGGRGRE